MFSSNFNRTCVILFIAWKYPSEALSTWTQLIVHESQEAILFKGGKALDVFGSGKYTLDTANIPLLNKIVNLPFGGRSPFTAEVWFVNRASVLDVKWGTPSPIQLQDPKYGVFIPVRSYGQFGLQIVDSKKFLVKLVGTVPVFDRRNLINYFRGIYLTNVKDAISSYLVHKRISTLEINAYLKEISEHMREEMSPLLEPYGITLVNFYVNDISVPEEDPAVIKLKAALAKRAEMDIIGYDYTQERSFDTLEGAATNPGSMSSGLMGAGMGLGMGLGAGQLFGMGFSDLGHTFDIKTSLKTVKCPRCHSIVTAGKSFCPECGGSLTGDHKEEVRKEPVVHCNACGSVLKKNVKFCPECGNRYNPCPSCGADIPEGASMCPQCGHGLPTPCPNCGNPVSEDAKFCPECGMKLIKACSNCGAEITGKSKFCPQCGNKLNAEA